MRSVGGVLGVKIVLILKQKAMKTERIKEQNDYPEKVCELIRQKFDDWVFGVETQSGEKLKVVDSADFNDIITEIECEIKKL